MELFLLLLVPLLIALIGFLASAYSKNKGYVISFREFLVIVGAVAFVIVAGYFISRMSATLDYELWNGRVVNKQRVWTSCEHSYPCNPHSCMCDSKGNCSTCWDTCYQHSNDWNWVLYTSNNEQIRIARIDSQGVRQPPRFTSAKIGDPTALVHSFTNYIKANPWTILRREGALEKFKGHIPDYPISVHDYHYVDRFLSLDGKVPSASIPFWNRDLMEINADLGKKKEVNMIFVVAPTADSSYVHALEEAWLGGKKNDLVVIFGVTEYPKIDWVRVMSWTHVEELKVALRDTLQDVGSLEKREEIVGAAKGLTDKLFVRTHMKDYEYLMAGVRPPTWALITLFVLGTGLSVGLSVYFYMNDPFDTGRDVW